MCGVRSAEGGGGGDGAGCDPALCITTDTLRGLEADPEALAPAQRREVERLAHEYQFFHWHLAFPEVFQGGGGGGFDCALGNPPWERTELKEKEWFAERNPQIAGARTGAERKRLINNLKREDPPLYDSFTAALRQREHVSHLLRNTGRFPHCGRGRVNYYAVFAEAMRNVLNERGRVGCVLPTGIATDDTTKFFFQDVVETKPLVSLFDFENRSGLFPDVDSRMKFCLFTAGKWRAACRRLRRVLILRPLGRGVARPRASLHPLAGGHRATEPEHSYLPDLPLPPRRRVGQGDLPARTRANPQG